MISPAITVRDVTPPLSPWRGTSSRRRLLGALVACSLLAQVFPTAGSAQGGSWPQRIVRMLTPTAPGGSVDVAARIFAEGLAGRWGRPVIVENRPGADGIIGVQGLLRSTDEHTLLFSFPGVVTIVPLLHDQLPYDAGRDLLPIASVASDYLVIAVNPAIAVGSLDGLVALARTRPGQINWTAAPGAPYLTFLEFQRRAGLTMVHVPYRSSVLALPDLVDGRIQVTVTPLASAIPLANDGKLKLLAVTPSERAPAAPLVPTAIELGYPELAIEAPLGLFGPKTMPLELRERIATDVQALASDPAISQRLTSLGMAARASTPSQYAATLAEQRARWTALARAHGLRPQ
jgi:tripartite-type tricarboxylate transporter receptor subunit TctC